MSADQHSGRRVWPTTHITLLERIADQQDDHSWETFVQTYGPLIRTYCRRRGLQESDANDVAQDVLLQVSHGIASFRYDAQRGRFRNWLGTVTHRAMLKHQSRVARPGAGSGESPSPGPLVAEASQQPLDGVWVEAFNAHVYREAVERLALHFDESTWAAFNATFAEERPPMEVAQELGRSVGWVYQAKSQVVRRLREEILYLAEDSVLLNLQPPT